ncbi:hypothetical protein [Streptomyces sp. NPDC059063]|uniref:hypothetical protein n=1 Tax=unclassified Streptomyces TaxID=2593676 RepID=UPI0036B388E1
MVGTVALGIVAVMAVVAAFQVWDSMTGGPIRSAAEYENRVTETKAAGKRAIRQLTPAPRLTGTLPGATLDDTAEKEDSTSCVDDFGVDDAATARDQPLYSWDLTFHDRDAYLKAMKGLRKAWTARGLSVQAVPSREKGEPGHGLPGIKTTDDGIDVYFGPDYYSDKPVVRADGGCVRWQGAGPDHEKSS